MKGAIAICFLALASAALAHPHDDKYTSKYDGLDVDEILGNERLMDAYMLCCLDKGKCTAEGQELKSHITDALENHCARCTKIQHDGIKKVISKLINHMPVYWQQLKDKYDPTGKYTAKYEKELKELKN